MTGHLGRRAMPLLCLVLASCSGDDGSGAVEDPQPETLPLAVILVENGPDASPDLPWVLSDGRDHVSSAMLTPGSSPGSADEALMESLIQEALGAGLLLALVDMGGLPRELDRDHILIETGPGGHPSVTPPELMDELPDSAWRDPLARQAIIEELVDVYSPDLTLVGVDGSDATILSELLEFWTGPEQLTGMNLVILKLPGEREGNRGWAVIAGPNVNGQTPAGLDTGVLLSTMELMCGLDWEVHLPDRIPALDILIELPEAWRIE